MAVTLSFNYHEAKILLNWHENSNVRSERFGSSRYSFPQEELLVEKLKNPVLHNYYEPMDIEIMMGWMEKSLQPGVGQEKFYFPLEEEIHDKLKKAREQGKTEIKSESAIKRESAIQYADQLIYEKKVKLEENEQEMARQRRLQQRIKAKKEEQERKKLSHRIKSYLEKFFYFGKNTHHK